MSSNPIREFIKRGLYYRQIRRDPRNNIVKQHSRNPEEFDYWLLMLFVVASAITMLVLIF